MLKERGKLHMDLHYSIVFSISVLLLFSQLAFADNSSIPWKITIKRNGIDTNNTSFWPPELQARQGDTVTWINNDTISHTITSGVPTRLNYSAEVFDSGILNPGQKYSFNIPIDKWSAYYYFCKIHPWMTGKIDVGNAYLEKSDVFTISVDKKSYHSNDIIRISGTVNDTTQTTMPMTIQIFDSQRNLVFVDKTNLLQDRSFIYELKATDSILKSTGNYKIKAFYGFPATVTDVNFFFNNQSQDVTDNGADVLKIPYWVKNNAKWWAQNQISDEDFVKGIQYLISSGELKTGITSHASTKTDVIPSWIKSNAGWWASGTISDDDFISGIQYLIDHSIIDV